MPGVFILFDQGPQGLELQKLAEAKGFRVRSTADGKAAVSCLKAQRFDLALVPAHASIKLQQDLGGELWEKNPNASLLLYDLGSQIEIDRFEARLSGAEIVLGRGALLERLDHFDVHAQIEADSFKIIVVDDLDSPRDIICAFVESIGYRSVSGKRSAKEALAALKQDPQAAACLLTDIKMPDMDGKELIEVIRSEPALQHLPIIVITAIGTVDCLVDCLTAGASGFLVKPPKRADLRRELARAVRTISQGLNPRLLSKEDIALAKDILLARGFV